MNEAFGIGSGVSKKSMSERALYESGKEWRGDAASHDDGLQRSAIAAAKTFSDGGAS